MKPQQLDVAVALVEGRHILVMDSLLNSDFDKHLKKERGYYIHLINSFVVPWTISAENVAERTVEQYFVSTVQKYLPSGSRGPAEKWILRGALLGRSKEALDNIELNVPLRIAANMFGGFLRYHVEKLELVKNRKDELFNDLVDFLQANNLVAANTAEEAELDLRVKQFIEMEPEEPGTIFDLRELKNPEKKTTYNVFWNEAATYFNEGVGTAVDDRRHSVVTHLSIAISIRDFREQVKARCAEGTLIPSDEWIRLQFWPKCKTTKTALQYTGRLNIRFMVQARQFRKTHEDAHYTAAIFRYVKKSLLLDSENILICFVWMINIE
eukprot:Em0149g6a